MKIIKQITILALLIIGLASCGDKYTKETGRAYMPDMSYSRAYEFYSENPNYKNGITAQAPVKGTIARGALMPDHLTASDADTNAYKILKFSADLSEDQIKEGGRLFDIHCAVCHGNNLDGNGPLYNGGNGKYPAAPANFKDPKYLNLPVGTMYRAIMQGKNLMGSYASQLDAKQRWMVLAYIKKVQSENGGAPFTNSFNSGNATTTTTTTSKIIVKDSTKKDVVTALKEVGAKEVKKEVSKNK